MKSAFVSLIL